MGMHKLMGSLVKCVQDLGYSVPFDSAMYTARSSPAVHAPTGGSRYTVHAKLKRPWVVHRLALSTVKLTGGVDARSVGLPQQLERQRRLDKPAPKELNLGRRLNRRCG